MTPPQNAVTEPLSHSDDLVLEEAERFVAQSEMFWWKGQKLKAKAHVSLFTRLYALGAFLAFTFAAVSHLAFGYSRWIWYPPIGLAYFLAWRGCRYYRVLRLFERAGPQTFEALRRVADHKKSAQPLAQPKAQRDLATGVGFPPGAS